MVIAENERGMKLGVWLMPGNVTHGMMETVLTFLIPDPRDASPAYASETRETAKGLGAPYQTVHVDKSRIHAWLAWQDTPGRQLHDAIVQRILAPDSEHAGPFARWFRKLVGVWTNEHSPLIAKRNALGRIVQILARSRRRGAATQRR